MTESNITPREAKLSAELHDALQANANLGTELGALKQEHDEVLAAARVTQENLDLARERVSELEGVLGEVRDEYVHATSWEDLVSAMKRVGAILNSATAAKPPKAQQPAVVDGLELAARWVDRRLMEYDAAHGSTDPDTGTREYPGNGDEYVGELMEIAEGIRAQIPVQPKKCLLPPSGWACSRAPGHDGPCAATVCRHAQQPATADERQAFEREYAKYAALTTGEVSALWDGDLYQDQGMRDAWHGWMARAALAGGAQ